MTKPTPGALRILSITDHAEGPPDVYFLPGYGRAASIADGGEWLLLEAHDGAWQVPLIVRTLPDGAKDAISPTFSGIYASSSLSSVQIQEAWSASIDNLRDHGIISLVVRSSPLIPQATPLPGLHSISSGRPTIVLELTDEASAWDGMRSSSRSRIRKALKSGYTGVVRPVSSPDLAAESDFRRLYEQTMLRRSANPLYFFGDNYYTQLLDGLGPNLLLTEVRDRSDVVVSSTLLMRYAGRLHYHLAGSAMDDARMGSNNLMMWTATQFAIAQGLRQFHIGAGVSGRDGVFRFKSTFGGRELEYAVSGLIVDDERYQALVEDRAKECGTTTAMLLDLNFFPAYRAGTTVG